MRPCLVLLTALLLGGCFRSYDLVVDNRTMTSLTLRVFPEEDGRFSQYPIRIFELPPNREFFLKRAIVATRPEVRRLFEFRSPDEQIVDSFVLTGAEIEARRGRITVPRAMAGIPRDAPPVPGFVDSTPHERVDFIPLFPEEDAPPREDAAAEQDVAPEGDTVHGGSGAPAEQAAPGRR